jgi:transcriptional regulator with XRE-family HTH domain
MPAEFQGADPQLAAALRSLREDRQLSQHALATRAGITTNTLARIERGESNPSWTTVRSLINALGVSVIDLGQALDQAP